MTKPVLGTAREAPAAGEAALPAHSRRFSRRDFTQPQLFALLMVRRRLLRPLFRAW